MLLAMAICLAIRLSSETQIVSRLQLISNLALAFYWPRHQKLRRKFFLYSGDPLHPLPPLKRETSFGEIPFLLTLTFIFTAISESFVISLRQNLSIVV